MSRYRHILYSTILILCTTMCLAQPQIKFASLGIQDGLSHSWAKSIEKDSKGFLWVGTINGANRYDGRAFKVFKNDPDNASSLSDNFIQAIKEDSRGNIWIGTYSGGLNLFNRQTESFRVFRNQPKNPHTLSDDRIHTIYEDSQGRLWIGTESGLDLYNYEQGQFRRYHVDSQPHLTIKHPVLAICEDANGALWVGTSRGLFVIQMTGKEIKKYGHIPSQATSLSSDHITSIHQDENNQIWIGTLGGGLNLYNPVMNSFIRFEHSEDDEKSLSHNSVLCLSGDENGRLFIGTEGGGVNIMNLNTRKLEAHVPQIDNPTSINSNSIHALYHDTESEITWIGTYHGGLNYFSKLSKPFAHYKAGPAGLNNSNVLCITEDLSGKIYVGTDGGGVNIIDKRTNKMGFLVHEENSPDGLLSNAVLSLLIDSKENLWVGTFNGGLDMINRKNGLHKRYVHHPSLPGTLSGRDVSAIYEDKKGNLWVGTMKGGLNLFDAATETFRHYQHAPGNPASIRDNFISGITEDSQGHLLIQTGKSLEVFDPGKGTFTSFGPGYNVTTGMPIATLEDSRENLWIGTREELRYFDRKKNTSMSFTEAQGLPSSSIAGILEDGKGNIWISTMRGLVKFTEGVASPEMARFQVYTVEDGLQGNDFKDQACYRGADGTLYFGGQNGLNAFQPEQIKVNPVAPPVVLTSFKIFNKEVAFGTDQPIAHPINESTEITLNHKHNVFSFEFSALNFILPEKNKYAYKMEGFEENWNHVGNQNSATYTNLNPGTYQFRVRAANNDGIWNEQGTSISIRILPPWWQTNWFRLLAISCLMLGIMVVFRIRLYQLKLRQKVLKKQVGDATLEIKKVNKLLGERNLEIQRQNDTLVDKNLLLTHQNEELESQSRKIQNLLKEIQELSEMKLRFFTNISHELRSPLTLIIGPLENLIAKAKSQFALQNEHVVMHRNAVKLLQLINQLLDFRKIESGNIQLKAREGDIVAFAKEIYASFSFLAEKKQIHYTFTADHPQSIMWFDPEKMEKIITNLLSNSFKYTPESGSIHMSLQCAQDGRHMDVVIKDSGTGIPADQIEHIFDLYYQAQNASNLKQAGTGIGLALIKQFVELHHGEIFVYSTEGLGTTLRVQLPLGSSHLSLSEMLTDDHIPEAHASQYTTYELESHFSEMEETPAEIEWGPTYDENPTLLVVEDNPDIRHYIAKAFSSSFKIAEASDGKEALEIAMETTPDLIISDVNMPNMDGFALCEKLKTDERTSHISVILLTAYSGEEKQQQGFSSGADDYVIKPFNVDILRQKIKNIISTRHNLIEKFSGSTSLDATKLTSNSADAKFMKKAIEVIESNLDNSDFSVEDFSDEFRMSRRNLLRKIKSVTGLSVNEFVKNIRMKKSVYLLQDAEMNISEVAYAVGFSDPKYFSKCFKEQFGKSPSDFVTELQR